MNVQTRAGDLKEAMASYRVGMVAAESGRHEDLLNLLELSQSEIMRSDPPNSGYFDVRMKLNGILAEARELNVGRLEAAACSELAKLALEQGDVEGARGSAMAALEIVNRQGLQGQQIRALERLADATIRSGQAEFGRVYLEWAQRLSEEEQFWKRAHEIEHKLLQLKPAHAAARVMRFGSLKDQRGQRLRN